MILEGAAIKGSKEVGLKKGADREVRRGSPGDKILGALTKGGNLEMRLDQPT